LAVSCAGILYIHFRGLLPPNGILPAEKSTLRPSLRSAILDALLRVTQAVGVSQGLRRCAVNGIMELSQRAPPILGRAAITLDIGPHSSYDAKLLFLAPVPQLQESGC